MNGKPNEKRRRQKQRAAERRQASNQKAKEQVSDEQHAHAFRRRQSLRKECHIALPIDIARRELAEPAFVDLLRLTKLTNSLLFLVNAVIDPIGDDDSVSVRRRITGGLLIGAMTCETLKVAADVVKHEQFAKYSMALQAILEHPLTASVKSGYFARARDKTAFHADKAVMKTALAGLNLPMAILEHVSGWNTLNTYYPTADLLAYLHILGDDLPSDDEITSFCSTVKSQIRRLQPDDFEEPFDNAVRRAVEVTVQVSGALCAAISELTVQAHQHIGGALNAGPPKVAVH
ncbi:hypothetical protein [Gemmatimonas groenlandica]|uniref:Uncharacterized protein n=1 Tax=Gemmatimonas groenlandica TaxID=2732249 RepID=A0A6M4IS02_9BACT|nr:hypothetical protein [Gemmatimonas groenlandica]QJR36519.1 hypothetical protein HKW67_13895 [Gemmatimonas groenlandica]